MNPRNKEKIRVIVTDPIDDEALQELKKNGFVVDNKCGIDKEELKKIISRYDCLIGRTTTKVNQELLKAATNLKCVGVVATGWDHIDVTEANRHNVVLLGMPPHKDRVIKQRLLGSFIPTAEHAILTMLAAAGNFYEACSSIRAGRWEKYRLEGTELYGKILGIIGLGRIGSLVAERAAAFGMKIIAFDPNLTKKEILVRGATSVSFKKLLQTADFITLHVHKTPETIKLINDGAFRLMKPGVIFINTARASVVDEKALIRYLKNGKIRCAAIDVHENEPWGVNKELVFLPNVLATPHIAGVSKEAIKRVSRHTVKSVINFFKKDDLSNAVNKPINSFKPKKKK